MKILMIDSSTTFLYVSFYDSETNQVLFKKEKISHNNHSENLLSVIEEGLQLNDMKLSDFDEVIVGEGPGSYTGLRIGMVVAKMACYTLELPLKVISSLTYCSSGYLDDGVYGVMSIAKKEHSYLQIFKINNGKREILVEDCFLPNVEANELILKYNAQVISEGSYKTDEKQILELSKVVDNLHDLVPNYLRKANS